jgi:hypothetical protein
MGMPENYRFMMDYEYQTKKEEIYNLKYIVSEIYILSNRFHKIFFVCEYQFWSPELQGDIFSIVNVLIE